jgi:hypothetical protein
MDTDSFVPRLDGASPRPCPGPGRRRTSRKVCDGHIEPRPPAGISTPVRPRSCDDRPSPTNRFAADQRPLLALDWSFKEVHVTTDGVTVLRYASVQDLLASLASPHKILAESTFESWDAARRRSVVDTIRAAGHEIYVFRPIHTARARGSAETKKSDENDAKTIHTIGVSGRLHVYPLPSDDPEWAERRRLANREFQIIRDSGERGLLVDAAVSVLGPYRELDDDARSVFGNGSGYYPALLAAVSFAAQKARSRDEFERLLGLHGSAYPSLLRSVVHHHGYRWARRRGVVWKVYRRELRRAYSALKATRPAPSR